MLSGPTVAPNGKALALSVAAIKPTCQGLADAGSEYLEAVSLAGSRRGALRRIGDDGVDDADCGQHTTSPARSPGSRCQPRSDNRPRSTLPYRFTMLDPPHHDAKGARRSPQQF